jgi:hypothetical protein
MDFGPEFASKGIVANEPPKLGEALPVLVPQVDQDGNDLGGIRTLEVAVPLGTFTGWNIQLPPLPGLHYLAGLVGSFELFPRSRDEREKSGDARTSIADRYTSRQDYLDRVQHASEGLVRQRLLLAGDVPAIVRQAGVLWDGIVK